jgi:hypothetical protein
MDHSIRIIPGMFAADRSAQQASFQIFGSSKFRINLYYQSFVRDIITSASQNSRTQMDQNQPMNALFLLK